MMDRNYKTVLLYGKKKSDEKIGQKIERVGNRKRVRPYHVFHWIKIALNQMARAADLNAQRSSAVSFVT